MPEWANEIIKHNPEEKSLKAPFSFFLNLECLLKKELVKKKKKNLVKITLKNLIQKKKLDMNLLAGHFLQDVNLIKKKINLIITEEKIVLKNYVKN